MAGWCVAAYAGFFAGVEGFQKLVFAGFEGGVEVGEDDYFIGFGVGEDGSKTRAGFSIWIDAADDHGDIFLGGDAVQSGEYLGCGVVNTCLELDLKIDDEWGKLTCDVVEIKDQESNWSFVESCILEQLLDTLFNTNDSAEEQVTGELYDMNLLANITKIAVLCRASADSRPCNFPRI